MNGSDRPGLAFAPEVEGNVLDPSPEQAVEEALPNLPPVPARRGVLASDQVRAMIPVAVVYLCSRIVAFGAAYSAVWARPDLSVRGGLLSWDSSWYTRLAETGYPSTLPMVEGPSSQTVHAFYPFLPALIRGMRFVTGFSYGTSGLLVSNIAGLLAVLAVYWAVSGRLGRELGFWTASLLAFFPSSFVFSMVYTDGVFIAAAALALGLLDRKRWLAAGVATAIAGLTRPTGWFVIAACAVAAGCELVRLRGRPAALKSVLAPMIGCLGPALFAGFLWRRTGDPLANFHVQLLGWGPGSDGAFAAYGWLADLPTHTALLRQVSPAVVVLSLVLAIGASVAAAVCRMPAHWWVYGIASALVPVSLWTGPSDLRYVMAAVPGLAALMYFCPARFRPAAVGVAAGGLGIFGLLATMAVIVP